MKRKLFLFLTLMLVAFLLASCVTSGNNNWGNNDNNSLQNDGNSGNGTGNGNSGSNTGNDNSGGDSSDSDAKKTVAIVYKIDELHWKNLASITRALSGYRVIQTTDIKTTADLKIIVGSHGDDLSGRADIKLLGIDLESSADTAYVIYSDGTSVAIAYHSDKYGVSAAENTAIDVFVSQYVSDGVLANLRQGTLERETIDIVEYQTKIDNEMIEGQWEIVETGLTMKMGTARAQAIVASLKSMYAAYSDDVIDWFANLYDPKTGGYYYSNSAKNTIGFLPDVESTAQSLGFIKSSGLSNHVNNDLTKLLPEEMRRAIISWVKGLQDSTNGYFYHPQWGKELTNNNASRLGRDVGMATSALAYLNALPTYDTPNGVKGDGILPDGSYANIQATAFLTGTVSSGMTLAVSRVVLANSSVPAYLQNKDTFTAYLNTININANSYVHGSTLEAQAPQILQRDKELKAQGADYSLCDILKNWLDARQNENTGLWTTYDYVDYEGVNGLLKISSVYQKIRKPVPNIARAIESAMAAIEFEEPLTVCFFLNPWYSLSLLYQNVSSFYTSPTLVGEVNAMRERLYENFPSLVDTTVRNIAKFAKDDGSYSFELDSSAATAEGMPVAVRNTFEGDVNATSISIMGISTHIMEFLDRSYTYAIPLYTKADWIRYDSILSELGPVIKDEDIKEDPLDMEDEIVPFAINPSLNSIGAYVAVEKDTVYEEESNVLTFVSRPHETLSDELEIFTTDISADYNAYAFEADVKFVNYGESNAAYDLNFCALGDNAYTFQVYAFDEYYGSGGWESNSVFFSHNGDNYRIRVADTGAYFKLRAEYCYTDKDYTGDGKVDILVRLYVNGTLVTEGHTPYRTSTIYGAEQLNKFEFRALRGSDSAVYLDNIVVEQFKLELKP